MFVEIFDEVFGSSIELYHRADDVDFVMPTPYAVGSFEMLLFHKSWIDTVQWHLEDIIRNPEINPVEALKIKRRIDQSNQDRTDKVEYIDSYFLDKYSSVVALPGADLNSETLAWAIDRYSILALKIYHMREQVGREGVAAAHRDACQAKLNVLLEQKEDLGSSIERLISDVEAGRKIIKTYKQMKMYNDPSLNPVLYSKG